MASADAPEGTRGKAPDASPDVSRGARALRFTRLAFEQSWDVVAAGVVALAAAASFLWMADGSVGRLIFTLPLLLFVPGYLLLSALRIGTDRWKGRSFELFFSTGISPAIVGFIAMAAGFLGALRADAVVGSVTAVCILLALLAMTRRGLARSLVASV